ncbi:hypothetical protein IPA_06410 [Ignicoccus pacificus DSM 13166]|uniref:Uncharacterized protein n=1 Tax=Ignicoccus pacificus DSM 13166 TaxID=940294 RepID=A0A977KBF3_9CREN|nr:hypothetical protein IPA_06410 [Ignicoccus pacificus DSM 13166]
MKVYLASMELHGPLFFSSETKHALTTASHLLVAPKAIISPIPLTYALNNLPAERWAWPDSPPSYEGLRRARKIFYGALPSRVKYKRFFFAMKGFSWGEYRGKPKRNAPRMVTMVALVPPSTFKSAIVSEDPLPPTLYLRIGSKRSGILKVQLEEVRLEKWEGTLTLPITREFLKTFGCNVKSFTTLLTTFSGEEVGLAEVEGCKVYRACGKRRCEVLAIP